MTKKMRPRTSARAIRIKACELAAQVMAGRPDDMPSPMLWSMAVFFECYIDGGAGTTRKDFGPKEPVKLRVAK